LPFFSSTQSAKFMPGTWRDDRLEGDSSFFPQFARTAAPCV
jgi:hypothetical protein